MIMLMARFTPHLVFDLKRQAAIAAERSTVRMLSTGEMLGKLVPIAALVALVLGGLYTGFFTPTEAGGVGAFGAFVIAILRRKLGGGNLWRVLTETGAVSVGILILLVAAGFYSRMLSVAGVPVAISDLVQDSGFGPYGFLLVYVLILLLLGMILDSSSCLLYTSDAADE